MAAFGTSGKNILHIKRFLPDYCFSAFVFKYPASHKDIYEPVALTMENCARIPEGGRENQKEKKPGHAGQLSWAKFLCLTVR